MPQSVATAQLPAALVGGRVAVDVGATVPPATLPLPTGAATDPTQQDPTMPSEPEVLASLLASARAQERAARAAEALASEVRMACQEMANTRTLGVEYLARAKAREARAEAWYRRIWDAAKPGIVALIGAAVAWLSLGAAGRAPAAEAEPPAGVAPVAVAPALPTP